MKLTCRCGTVHERTSDTTYVVTAAKDAARIGEIEREIRRVDAEGQQQLMREAESLTSLLLVCPDCRNLMWCRPDGVCTAYRFLGDVGEVKSSTN